MLKQIGSFALLGLATTYAPAQVEDAQAQADAADRGAVTETLETYARARAEGDVTGAKSCVHHDVARRVLSRTFWGQPSDDWVRPLNHDQFGVLARSDSPARRNDPESAKAEVEVFDIATESASAIIAMDDITEIVHMVRFDGSWLIADSVVIPSHTPPAPATEADLSQIEQVAVDYTMGFYEIDGDKVQGTCHSDLSKRCHERETEGGFEFLSRITWEEIRLLGNTFNRRFGFSPESARKDVEIYYADAHNAAAKLTGASWFDYLHLMKVNDEWKIVNIIYEPLPREQWQG